MLITTDENNPLAIVETRKSIDKNINRCYKFDGLSYSGDIYDDYRKHQLGLEGVSGEFNLLTVERKLIAVNRSNIDAVDHLIYENESILDIGDGRDYDKDIQDGIANLVAEKTINPTNKRIMGRSF